MFGPSDRRVALFLDSLARMIDAGLPVGQAFAAVHEEAPRDALGRFARDAEDAVTGGGGLAEAFAGRPGIFDPVTLALVDVGETTGKIPACLRRAAKRLEEHAKARNTLLLGLAYPAILIHLAVILPNLFILFIDEGGGTAAYFARVGTIIGMLWGALSLCWGLYRGARALPPVRAVVDGIVWRLPIIGGLTRAASWSEVLYSLSLMAGSGIAMGSAFDRILRLDWNAALAAELRAWESGITRWAGVTEASLAARSLPVKARHLIRAGEESGQLAETMEKAAELLADDANVVLRLLLTVIPIFVYLCAAAYIAWLVISFWLGIFGRLNEV